MSTKSLIVKAGTNPVILYVDDDQDDFYFFQQSLVKIGSQARLVSAANGEEAIHYLHEITSLDDLPSLIVLDLNMPRWDGRQTLKYLKEHPPFTDIPVVILSTSESKADREICEKLGAVSYVQKPNHFDGYTAIIDNFLGYMHHL